MAVSQQQISKEKNSSGQQRQLVYKGKSPGKTAKSKIKRKKK
jgi:hypothetical protein